MKIYTPDYFDKFTCRASACPDSCCRAGWEIPIDSQSYEFYRSAGIDIDENSYLDPDGDRAFSLREDKTCPYFREDGLCEIYIKTDGRLCEICAKYPRFFEEYDGFTEAGLSVSCPTAAGMILSRGDDPYLDLDRETGDELLDFLVRARKRAIEMIYSERDPDIAAEKLLGFGIDLQDLIDFGELDALDGIGLEPAKLFGDEELSELRRFILSETEILNPRWKELLRSEASAGAGTSTERRNYLAYLTYRYFLKAINTEDIATQCAFIVMLYQLSETLGEDYIENVRLIAKEIEHNFDNYCAVLGSLTD